MLAASGRSTLRGKELYVVFAVVVNIILFSAIYRSDVSLPPQLQYVARSSMSIESVGDAMAAEINYYSNYKLEDDDIVQRGIRSEVLRKWLTTLDLLDLKARQNLTTALDDHLVSLYPFLKHTSRKSPYLSTLRQHIVPGSRGIVISAGKNSFRWAAHAIGNIRSGVGSKLPIQVAYAGEDDLPEEYRHALEALYPGISCFNILDHFDDDIIGITHGEDWEYATKPFAVLASSFEEVLLVDADGTFLQSPESILDEHTGYLSTGALLFRDRAGMWTGDLDERIQYYHELMKHRKPSQTLLKSKVWNGKGSEHGESALVVLDKSRLEILMALIHTCWQNSLAVREKTTYKMTFGDKESWWMGLELTGTPYAMDSHYAGRIGEVSTTDDEGPVQQVCSNAMLHFDHMERPLWFNGGLLKARKDDLDTYISPESWHWMWDDGYWYSDECLGNGKIRNVTVEEVSVLQRSVSRAKALDVELKDLIDEIDIE